MIEVTEYEISTGRILMVRSFPDQQTLELNRTSGRDFAEGYIDGGAMYIAQNQATTRPVFDFKQDKTHIQANGSDVLTIYDLPNGECEVYLSGPITDTWFQSGDIALTVNVPGTYSVQISQWPYIDAVVNFSAS